MDEYISREAVIKKIAEVQDKATSGTEDVAYYRAIKIIRDMPAADVQPISVVGEYNKNIMDDEEKDMKFMTDTISQICNYAIENDMKPTETLKTVANNILMITEISNFDGWGSKDGDTNG